ncbi:MAG: hypothetical protein QNJ11_09450 [Woeseiaceae bacterium]|nr:hypothetical protein [Woeseiaceae bacterium]
MAKRFAKQLLGVALLVPALAMAAPGDVLFSDDFEDGSLAAWTTTNGSISGVSSNAGFAGSGSFGAFTSNLAVAVTSPAFNAAVPEARLQLWVRRGADFFSEDTDGGEDFVLEYRRADSSWAQLRTYLGGGTNGQIYQESFVLPPEARHGNLAIRLRQTAGSGFDFDYWHFDDVVVTEIAPATGVGIGSCDDFENGLSTNWTVNPTSGQASTSSATSQSPSNSLFLNGGIVEVTSVAVDTSDITFQDITMWIRRGSDSFSEDPDGGENLEVQYLNNGGAWVTLETFTGNGQPGAIFTRTYALPAAGLHAGFQLRFRMTGGSGLAWDYWHVDDVCFNQSTDPILSVTKLQQVLSDPVNGGTSPYAIPGAYVEYTIGVTNQGPGPVDADTLVVTDPLPPGVALYVDTSGGDPITFSNGTTVSGLSYDYATDVTFSNQVGGGPPYTYAPDPDGDGFDPDITGYRIAPGGSMNGASGGNNPSFNITLRVRIE